MKTFGIYTLGCKVNMYESEYITNLLINHSYIKKDFNDTCDIYIINTCSVTNNSDSKSRKIIREAIKKNKDACVIVMGCSIEAHKDINIEGIDVLIGNDQKSKILDYINEYFKDNRVINKVKDSTLSTYDNMTLEKFPDRTRAYVKIEDGCDNFCSYCIIPYIRGRVRSKNFDDVIEEIKNLVKNDYKEIVLTGICVGSYGKDINTNFYELLKEIVKIKGLNRIRISSIEIMEITDDIINLIDNNDIIVSHFHVPLQSGSNKILKLMNRHFNQETYLKQIDKLRKIRPNCSISTDVIIGFPSESEDDFNETYEFCKKIGFSKIHVFPYSKREGTYASKMKEQINGTIKKERVNKLIDLSKKLELEYMNKFINKNVEVLIETNDNKYSYGHSKEFLHVKIENILEKNKIYEIKLEKVEYPYIIGKVI